MMGMKYFFKLLYLAAIVSILVLQMRYVYDYFFNQSKQDTKQLFRTIGDHRLSLLVRTQDKLTTPYFDSHNTEPNYPINPRGICLRNQYVELVICVTVARDAFEHRRAVRETWGSYARKSENNAVLVFFVGLAKKEESPDIESKILFESQQYQDIVQNKQIDTYYNLTLKSISVIRWVNSYCSNSDFMLKIDADIYVNVTNLMKRLRRANTNSSQPLVLGNYRLHIKPHRRLESKWYVSESDYPDTTYPPYSIGAGYAISRAAYYGIAKATYEIKPFVFEDIYITGMCGRRAGVRFVNDETQFLHRFDGNNYCDIKKFTLFHGYSPKDLRILHRNLNKAKCV